MTFRLSHVVLISLLGTPLLTFAADSCMVSPTAAEIVSGRFGKYREGDAANYGSANLRPHMHDGLDFTTHGSDQPVFSTTDGTISFIGKRGTAGNTILVERGSGDVVGYYHLSGFAPGLRRGSSVVAGQTLGLSGNTPTGEMAKHLHFVYGTSQRDDARAAAFSDDAAIGTFDPSQLPSVFNQTSGIGWKTDPAPYFCKTYPIDDGHPEFYPILGQDTMAQNAILFGNGVQGSVASSGRFDSTQLSGANADALLAASSGLRVAEFLSDQDGFGTLPTTPMGGYDTMSTSEMMLTEAGRRFADADWNTDILKVSSRALWTDYVKAMGVSNYLSEAIYRKKEKVEALLAVYTSQKLAKIKGEASAAQIRAQKDLVRREIR